MGTITATADSSSTLGSRWYGVNGTTWYKGTTQGASQGSYKKDDSWVGAIVFKQIESTLTGKLIESITLTISADGGSSSSSKDIMFWRSNKQTFTFDDATTAPEMIGESLGTLSGLKNGTKRIYTLNSTTNSDLFAAMSKYFSEGNNTLIIYNGEKNASSSSPGYVRLIYVKIAVTYSDDPPPPAPESNTVWYHFDGKWVECAMYYRAGGKWIRVQPYYRTGSQWIKV